MSVRAAALLLLLAASSSCRQEIAIDTRAAEGIPAKIAIAGLRDLLPKAVYLSCGEPRVEISQSEVTSWTVDEKGVELRTKLQATYRLAFSTMRGADLAKLPLSYQLRVFVQTPKDPHKEFIHLHWRDEESARRALELFEALREDR